MGYRTPNIDRLADERMRFTDSYGEQSCTAGRSSFITGQSVFRTGLHEPILMPWWTDPVVFVLLLVGWLSARFLPRRPPG
jgi:arylsulfatase A-like enzyme